MLHINFSPFPELTTKRLTLRRLSDNDAVKIYQLRSDPNVNKYIGRPAASNIEEAAAFISKIDTLIKDNVSIYWAITFKGDSTLIGTICLWNFDIEKSVVEIGYELLPEYQRKGLMTEAVERVIEYGFNELEAEAITAFSSADNASSIALLRKCKFKPDQTFYSNSPDNPEDEVVYLLMKNDYSAE